MKTLFLSDLDGTLLNSDAQLSEFSKTGLNKLIENGVLFSVATARTFATVVDMFQDVNLNIPFILMNGVVIYDPVCKKNVIVHSIDKEQAQMVLECYKMQNRTPMLYFMRDDHIEIIYPDTDNPYIKQYVSQRDDLKRKVFICQDNYKFKKNDNLIYIVTLDKYENISEVYNNISVKSKLTSMFYIDNYTDCYFLETFSQGVSKSTGAQQLKEYLGVDKIVAFGDNLNDIPLFKIADESYAVSNAHEELKKIATGVIDSNNNDAVVRYLLKREDIIL